MNINGIQKAYIAEAVIPARRIIKHGTADDKIILAAAATDKLMGVTTEVTAAINEHTDVVKSGMTDIEFGGTVTRGDPLTSDATGRAVVAAPGAGVNNRIIGYAEVAGVVGDIGQVWIAPGVMQG